MGTLTGCIKKAGAALYPEDKAAIIARARELREGGTDIAKAAMQAVEEQLQVVRALAAKSDSPDAEKAAEAADDLKDALGDLGNIISSPGRMNITPEQEQKLLPVLTRLFDAAFRMGYYKFKDAARFVL